MCKLLRIFVQIYKMHRLILVLIPLFFITIACKKQAPEGILPKEEFVELMSEVHILDGYLTNINADSAKKVIDPLYAEVFGKFGLDSVSFSRNVNYYYGDPRLTLETYDQLIKNLEGKDREFYRQDSIKSKVYQDSVGRLSRLQTQAINLQQMIGNAKSDSLKMSIAEYTRRMYAPSGLVSLWEKNLYRMGDSAVPGAPTSISVPTPVLPEPEKLVPLEEPKLVPLGDTPSVTMPDIRRIPKEQIRSRH